MAAFDSNAYLQQYGGALAALSGAQVADANANPDQSAGAGPSLPPAPPEGASGDADVDMQVGDQGASTQANDTAPMPSPLQMRRMLMYAGGEERPPPQSALAPETPTIPANVGAQAVLNGQPPVASQPPPQSPQQTGISGPTTAQVDASNQHITSQSVPSQANMTGAEKDAVVSHVENLMQQSNAQHGHGVDNLTDFWNKTYAQALQQRAEGMNLAESAASKYSNPTLRDKAMMILDSMNRASILQAQYPTASKGSIWAMATRGALDSWSQQAAGMHNAAIKQYSELQDQAKSDANAAVQRQNQDLDYRVKAQKMMNDQQETAAKVHQAQGAGDKDAADAALTKAKTPGAAAEQAANTAKANAEARKADADAGKARQDRALAAKGTLVTTKEGDAFMVHPDGSADPVKDRQGNPINPQTKGNDTQLAQAREQYGSLLKSFSEANQKSLNSADRKKSPQQTAQDVLNYMGQNMPDLYKAMTGRAPVAASANTPTNSPPKPAWAK